MGEAFGAALAEFEQIAGSYPARYPAYSTDPCVNARVNAVADQVVHRSRAR
jgi:hypothetical protein